MAEGNSDSDWGFYPSVLKCVLCDEKPSVRHDHFMATCCDSHIVCNHCLKSKQGRIKCKDCKEVCTPFRVRAQFINSIINEAKNWTGNKKTGNDKQDTSKTGKITDENGKDMLERICEIVSTPPNVKVRQVIQIIHSIMGDFRHARVCKPYINIGYMCDLYVKYRKDQGMTITIHDMLAFTCVFCGHSAVNGVKLPTGETRRLSKHSMHECARECCGMYLDRRYLQYSGGRCECGVVIMNRLGIRLATDKENSWRRDLFVGRGGGVLKRDIQEKLTPTFTRLGIYKPQLLVWYIASKGEEMIKEMMCLSNEERDGRVSTLVDNLNREYGRNNPVQ